MSEEVVDVLIIGAGASGAAFAWSLAETRMNILCLEQGDWMDPAKYPGMQRDWEVHQFGDFGLSPNARGRREDYPVNDAGSPIAVSMFNAVGGSTILYAAHFPRFHPSDFRVEDARRHRRRLAARLPASRTVLRHQRAHDGRLRARRRSRLPAEGSAAAAGGARQAGRDVGARLQPARLALVAVGQRDHHGGVRGPCAVHQRRHVPDRLRARRQGEHRHHLLAAGAAPGRAAADALPCARDHGRRRRHGRRRHLLRRRPAPSADSARTSWCSPATASARRGCC